MKKLLLKIGPVDPSQKDGEIKKQSFVEPKLVFVRPKLVKQGTVEEITAGFFGSFYP